MKTCGGVPSGTRLCPQEIPLARRTAPEKTVGIVPTQDEPVTTAIERPIRSHYQPIFIRQTKTDAARRGRLPAPFFRMLSSQKQSENQKRRSRH